MLSSAPRGTNQAIKTHPIVPLPTGILYNNAAVTKPTSHATSQPVHLNLHFWHNGLHALPEILPLCDGIVTGREKSEAA